MKNITTQDIISDAIRSISEYSLADTTNTGAHHGSGDFTIKSVEQQRDEAFELLALALDALQEAQEQLA